MRKNIFKTTRVHPLHLLKIIGLDPRSRYRSYSQFKVSSRLFEKHKQWASDKAKGNYADEVLTLSWRRLLSNRNQSIDLLRKSMDWFLYGNGPRHERVKWKCCLHIETSQLVCCANQLTGFYWKATLAFNGLSIKWCQYLNFDLYAS